MSLFSKLFNTKPQRTFETPSGTFHLSYSQGKKNLWTANQGELLLTVNGTEFEPDSGQVKFLESVKYEIKKIDEKITKKFIGEFKEAGLSADITNWQERFKIVAVEAMVIFENEKFWNITFEDLKSPYAHFTLFIEGEKLTDFSMDT